MLNPVFVSTHKGNLLVFLPDTGKLSEDVKLLVNQLETVLGKHLRISIIDKKSHPEIVHSFGIKKWPSFLLIRQGIETWSHAGWLNSEYLIQLLSHQLQLEGKR